MPNLDLIQARLEAQEWKWAVTCEETDPHYYFISDWNPNLFSIAKSFIQYYGIYERGNKFWYLGDFKYWIEGKVLKMVRVRKEEHHDRL